MPKQPQNESTTDSVSVADLLEIFQRSAMNLAGAGVPVKFHPMDDGRIVLTVDGASVCRMCQKFRPIGQMVSSGTCQNCARTAQAVPE